MNKTLALNEKERERLVVLRQVKEGKLRQRAAAEQLQMSVRWVKKLLQRMRQQETGGWCIGCEGDRRTAVTPPRYGGGRWICCASATAITDRRWPARCGAGAWTEAEPRDAAAVDERGGAVAAAAGEAQAGACVAATETPARGVGAVGHVGARLAGRRGPKLYLIGMLDDASSELLARFVASDSTAENMRLLQRYIEQRGRPVAVYTDKSSLFQVNRPLHYHKHLEAGRRPTQIERALKELGIERITAHSPQAKGRIERCFGTLQDRLVKGLRQAGASCLREANRYLEQEFLPSWNQRFRHPPAEEADVHRPLQQQHQLASILSHVEQRVVGNDYTICWRGRRYQIPARQAQPRLRKAAVRVEQRLDGTLWLRWGQHEMRCELCRQPQTAPASPLRPPLKSASQTLTRRKPSRKNRWMDGFQLRNPAPRRPPLAATPVALRAPSVAAKANRTHAE